MYFDTHAHYDDPQFDADREEVLAALYDAGVELVVDPGSDVRSSRLAAEIAEKHAFVYAAAGIHPESAADFTPQTLAEIRALCRGGKVVAVGEIGLDYHYEDAAPREVQQRALYAQFELAGELGLPVIFHDREAHEDSLRAVRAFPGVKGVFHCYSGSLETARELLALGWYISFTGSITFKNARRAPEIVAAVPHDRIMIETDSPYMAPVPVRGRRNDSSYIKYICETAARFMGISESEAAKLTLENGKRFYGIENF